MLFRTFAAALACLFFLGSIQFLRADVPPDPLTFIPQKADFVAKIETPSALVRTIYDLNALKKFQKIDAVREILDSTNVRRVFQLIEYFEKKLGADRYELVDKLAGGGIVFASKVQQNPPVILILQGKDAKTTKKFVELAVEVLQQELERQESKQKIVERDYKGIKAYRLDNAIMAVKDATIVVSNKPEALKAVVDLALGKGGPNVTTNRQLIQARKTMDPNPAAWAWLNLESVRKIPATGDFFKFPEATAYLNANFIPPIIDLARRSPYVCASFHHKGNRFSYSVQFPRGLDGMPEHVATFFPKNTGESLPLLEPPNVLASASFYMDLAKAWKNRTKVLKGAELKQLEDFEKNSGRFLGGVKLSQLAKKSGKYYRVVVTQPTESLYKRKPVQPIPAFAVVHQMRDPSLSRSMDRMLRTVAILGAAGFNLKMVEEKFGDVTLVTYRFPENRELAQDTTNLRFNFSPCFATVGNQFLAASTVELGRDMVKLLQEEQNTKPASAMLRTRFYAAGAATALQSIKEQLVTQAVLSQAQPIEEARKQVEAVIAIVQDLGVAEIDTQYSAGRFRMNIRIDLGK